MSLAARIGDLHVCPMVTGVVPYVGGPMLSGEATVLMAGMAAARAVTVTQVRNSLTIHTQI